MENLAFNLDEALEESVPQPNIFANKPKTKIDSRVTVAWSSTKAAASDRAVLSSNCRTSLEQHCKAVVMYETRKANKASFDRVIPKFEQHTTARVEQLVAAKLNTQSQQIEAHLNQAIEASIKRHLSSNDFKTYIRNEISRALKIQPQQQQQQPPQQQPTNMMVADVSQQDNNQNE